MKKAALTLSTAWLILITGAAAFETSLPLVTHADWATATASPSIRTLGVMSTDDLDTLPAVTLEDALDAPELVWENDPIAPWQGVLRNPPSDDVVISPPLAMNQRSTLATTVTGPGVFSFRAIVYQGSGGVMFRVGNQFGYFAAFEENDRFTIPILGSTPVHIEWTVGGSGYDSWSATRLLLNEVKWLPHSISQLAEALDTPTAVTWSTYPQRPFTGRPHPQAKNGTAAYIALKPGEESWLEATVDGPGRFDFWLREGAGGPLPGYGGPWNYWSLTIDGVRAEISGTQWPEQWITAAGSHRIRLTFRHPLGTGAEWITGAVDDVTWLPLTPISLAQASGLTQQFWQTSTGQPAQGFNEAGRAAGPAIVMNPARWQTSWTQTLVSGPCELSWDSELLLQSGDSTARLEVNGAIITALERHDWQRMRLSLPRGIHAVRWVYERAPRREYDRQDEATLFSQVWKISGMRLQQGVSSLAQAVDEDSLHALEIGDAGGQRVVAGLTDYWESGLGASLYFFDPKQTGKMTVSYLQGGPGWSQQSESQTAVPPPATSGTWVTHASILKPGRHSKWTFDPGVPIPGTITLPKLDSLKLKVGSAVGLAASMESLEPVTSSQWLGITDRRAPVGRDYAWSLLNRNYSAASASMTLVGPATVSYRWKKQGPGKLLLRLNGAVLPVPPPGEEWTKVEFTIGSGSHSLSWSHTLGTLPPPFQFPYYYTSLGSPPSEAWLDGMLVQLTTPTSLTAAGTVDGSPLLSSSTTGPLSVPWQPTFYRDADGTWTGGLRSAGGGVKLDAEVSGPAVLEFSGRCFQGDGVSSARRTPRSVVIINYPGGDFWRTIGHRLIVEIDGVIRLQLDADTSEAWSSHSVHIPKGLHTISFSLMAIRSSWFGDSLQHTTDMDMQAWVADLNLISPSEHYAKWALRQRVAESPLNKDGDDADADGSSNFMEYSFSTNPFNAASRPFPLTIEMGKAITRSIIQNSLENLTDGVITVTSSIYPYLKVPYLPPHVSGVIESSEDLISWQIEPDEVLRYPPLSSGFVGSLIPESTSTYYTRGITIDTPKRYYRLAIQK